MRRKEKEEWRRLLPEFIGEFNRVKGEFLRLGSRGEGEEGGEERKGGREGER